MFRKIALALPLVLACSAAFSESAACKALARSAANDGATLAPPMAYEVTGTGRLYFHSAPDEACKIAGTFVVATDKLIGYQEVRGWTWVMYMTRTGDDVEGWVRGERLRETGTVGPTDR